jgi:signal transduction histidine kinase
MLQRLAELCSTPEVLRGFVIASDLAIAAAYFAIPLTMAVVFWHRKQDIPYPWLWTLFVLFIVACGLTHLSHVWSAFAGYEALKVHAVIGLFCAAASVCTAIAFAFIVPQIKDLPSPRQQHAALEKAVAERTLEKDRLIREINHRVGNHLQIVASLLTIESRKTESDETYDALERIAAEVNKLALQHKEMSAADYLRHDMTVAPAT